MMALTDMEFATMHKILGIDGAIPNFTAGHGVGGALSALPH